MVSPIEGTVSDINQAVMKDPKLALRDPYGEGWLVTVNAPDAKTSFKNLLGGPLARWWTEESASRLQRRMPMAFAGALAQDGGVADQRRKQPDPRPGVAAAGERILPVLGVSHKSGEARTTSPTVRREPQKYRPPGFNPGRPMRLHGIAIQHS